MDDVEKYQSFVDAEWNIIYEKLDQCVKSGAQVWFCTPITKSLLLALLRLIFKYEWECTPCILH